MTIDSFATVAIHGKDSQTFLQGQLTCDMNSLTTSHAQLAACCDLKGRVVASFLLLLIEQPTAQYLAILPSNNVDNLLNHLQKYAVFSKVKLELDSSWALSFNRQQQGYVLPGDTTTYLQVHQQEQSSDSSNDWFNYLTLNSLCLVEAPISAKFLPMMLGYDRFGGINFEKGCYLGQEVIARAHYRGQIKRHLHRLMGTSPITGLSVGDTITDDDDKSVGTVVQVIQQGEQQHLLAVIQDSAEGKQLTAHGIAVSPND